MNVAFTYNVKHTTPSKNLSAQSEAEFDSPETIEAIKKALENAGHTVFPIEADENAYSKFLSLKAKITIVFNIAEGIRGESRESHIPAILEILDIPYTHSGILAQSITLDKALTKKVLSFHGIKTPKFFLVRRNDQLREIDSIDLSFPLIVKPNAEGSSKGIFSENLAYDKVKLAERIRWLLSKFREHVLVEEFLRGREFTVSMLGNPPKILPIVEQNYAIFPENMPHFASYEAKWLFEDSLPNPHEAYFCPPDIDTSLQNKIEDICFKTWEALELKDVCRIDLRFDNLENPSILEVNTLPGLIPDPNVVAYFPIAARKAGYSYEGMVNSILDAALLRYGLKKPKPVYQHIPKPLTLGKPK
ncbi:ATP-grasp domain-containing protein [Candidatus Gottesmanbacteria bacterium]|nr:ATP-grasp domain-containing protein [Candidatus Gottesmanbacteria bacterium]